MNDFKATVRDFLRNHEQRDIRFRMNQSNVILLKVRFDEETDFIYMMSCCGDGDPLGDSLYMDNRPEYAGIYSVIHDRVICPSYYFGFCCDAEKSEDFRKEIASAVTRRIIELVNNSPVPATEESRPFDSRIDYYSQHGAHEEALRWYFNDDLPHDYVPNVDPDSSIRKKSDRTDSHPPGSGTSIQIRNSQKRSVPWIPTHKDCPAWWMPR